MGSKNSSILMGLQTTSKTLIGQTPFILVYGQEAVMPMEFIVPSLRVIAMTNLTYTNAIRRRLEELMKLVEDIFIAGFHQNV